MLALASGVKIDAADEEGLDFLSRRVGTLHRQGISVIAKNVDTRERFERCVSIGADRYQGQFLQEPERLESGELPVDQIARLELLSVVNDPEAGIDRFESAISKDITLSYKLLRYINSAMFSLQREIGSIRHAVTMLGIRWTRTWSNLVILSAVSDRPQAVVTTAMVRAKMCEQLARRLGCAEPESHFTAGLLSMLDVFLGQDMHRILERLPLEEGLRDALLEGTGERGLVLEAARAYERSIWEDAVCPGLTPGDLRDAYLDALIFARDTRRFLGELAPAA
ncbi:MAG: HDOD domain-containing protein [Planctomycetota bacterium]